LRDSRRRSFILDELGYLPFAQTGSQLLFHLISRLYERTFRHQHHQSGLWRLAPRREPGSDRALHGGAHHRLLFVHEKIKDWPVRQVPDREPEGEHQIVMLARACVPRLRTRPGHLGPKVDSSRRSLALGTPLRSAGGEAVIRTGFVRESSPVAAGYPFIVNRFYLFDAITTEICRTASGPGHRHPLHPRKTLLPSPVATRVVPSAHQCRISLHPFNVSTQLL
jgi:hypothetical protein